MQKLKVVVFSLDASMKPLSQNKKINDWFRLCSDSVFCFIELKSDIDALDQSFLYMYVCWTLNSLRFIDEVYPAQPNHVLKNKHLVSPIMHKCKF